MKEPTILEEANSIIYGARESDYGHPYDMAKGVADAWRTHFGWGVKPRDVAVAMILMKLVREKNKPKRDNRVDLAGYAGVLDRILEREAEIEKVEDGRTECLAPTVHSKILTVLGSEATLRECGCTVLLVKTE